MSDDKKTVRINLGDDFQKRHEEFFAKVEEANRPENLIARIEDASTRESATRMLERVREFQKNLSLMLTSHDRIEAIRAAVIVTETAVLATADRLALFDILNRLAIIFPTSIVVKVGVNHGE